jgi:hypothetical protein
MFDFCGALCGLHVAAGSRKLQGIDGHENGKKHKEAIQESLKGMRARGYVLLHHTSLLSTALCSLTGA